jgi:hypothetical protein
MFYPDSFGFQYSTFIHHRRYITTVTDRILKNTLQGYEILTWNFKKSNLTESEIECIFESPEFGFFRGYVSYEPKVCTRMFLDGGTEFSWNVYICVYTYTSDSSVLHLSRFLRLFLHLK